MDVPDMFVVRDAALQRLADSLPRRGWRVAETDPNELSFAMDRPEGIVFTFRPNPSVRSSRVLFRPGLGAGSVEVGRLSLVFKGREGQREEPAVGVGRGLSDLLLADGLENAPFTRWAIQSEDDVEAVVNQLVQDLDTYGMRFLERFTNRGELIAWMQADKGFQMMNGILAITCALEGRDAEAIVALCDYAEPALSQTGRHLEQPVRYVRSFVTHFGIGDQILQQLPASD